MDITREISNNFHQVLLAAPGIETEFCPIFQIYHLSCESKQYISITLWKHLEHFTSRLTEHMTAKEKKRWRELSSGEIISDLKYI